MPASGDGTASASQRRGAPRRAASWRGCTASPQQRPFFPELGEENIKRLRLTAAAPAKADERRGACRISAPVRDTRAPRRPPLRRGAAELGPAGRSSPSLALDLRRPRQATDHRVPTEADPSHAGLVAEHGAAGALLAAHIGTVSASPTPTRRQHLRERGAGCAPSRAGCRRRLRRHDPCPAC